MLRGACADLTGLVNAENYSAGTLEAVSSDGKLYAVPMSFSTCILIYNKALFDQAGIAYPTNDWTWADVQTAAEAIKALGDDIWGFYQPISYNEFYKSVKGNGGSLLNDDYTAFTANSPENVEVLDAMIKRVRGENHVQPTAEEMAGRGDWDLFTEGKLGMIITGIWGFPTFSWKWDRGLPLLVPLARALQAILWRRKFIPGWFGSWDVIMRLRAAFWPILRQNPPLSPRFL